MTALLNFYEDLMVFTVGTLLLLTYLIALMLLSVELFDRIVERRTNKTPEESDV